MHRFHILRCRRLCFIHGNNQRDIRPNPSARCCVVELMSFLLAHTSICHLTIERLTLVISASNFHRIRNVSNRYAFVLCIAISTRRCYWYTGDKLTCLSETTCRRFFDRLLVFMGNSIRSSAPAAPACGASSLFVEVRKSTGPLQDERTTSPSDGSNPTSRIRFAGLEVSRVAPILEEECFLGPITAGA